MENIKNLVEQIFSHAVALDQNGGLKNTIYAIDNEVFILNYDHTVLLRFLIRQEDVPFQDPVAFKASDYDSNMFEERDGRITFFSKDGEYERKKTCGTSDMTPAEVQELYLQYVTDRSLRQTVQLTKNVLALLDDSLSHIEFSGIAGESLKMIQRNIYSGGIIEVQKSNKGLFKDNLTEDFGPVGMKTEDFRALFMFQDVLNFSFPSRGKEDFILVKRGESKNTLNMTGVIACCLYDEIIEIREARSVQTENKTKMIRSK
jgi:hypothetical protein